MKCVDIVEQLNIIINMNNEYIILNKTAIQKRIENLDLIINDGKPSGSDYIELKLLKQILSQSTPLIPEIEEAYDSGMLDKEFRLMFDNPKARYINSLTLDI